MTIPIPAGWKPRLACPFCGSNCLFTEPDEYGSGGQWVSPIHVGCNDCKAEQSADTEDEAVDRWNRRSSPASVAPGDAQDGLAEAQRLAQALFQRHFAQDDDYASGRVRWEVLGDLPGVLSQIDNMVSGLVRPAAPVAGDALDAARLDWLEQHDGRFYNKDRISSIVGAGFLVAGDEQGVRHQTVRAAIDAAIAALAAQVPQQGEA
ncbi:Lar family restriction alleviation protein [Achromobacter insolitus]|uniref:Lar family restriction alleviation protein n=1 Tax=Achromobacter insolitus TaxID=217204 RepID=UPI003B9BC7DE